MFANQTSPVKISGNPMPEPSNLSEIETEMNRLHNAIECLENVQGHHVGRLVSVSCPQAPTDNKGCVQQACGSPLASSIQSMRNRIDAVTARLSEATSALAI
jgi:hypothetical protein